MLIIYFLFDLHDTWQFLWEKFLPRSNIISQQSFQYQTFGKEYIISVFFKTYEKTERVKLEMQDPMLITPWGVADRTVEREERTLSVPASCCEPLADCSRLCYQWSRRGGGPDTGEGREKTDLLSSL